MNNYTRDPEASAKGRDDARNGAPITQGHPESYYLAFGSEIRKQKKEKLEKIALQNHDAMWEGLGPDGISYPANFSTRVRSADAHAMRQTYDKALSDRVALLLINESWPALGRLLGEQARDYLLTLETGH